jgi:transmembrane sensor
MRCFAMNDPIWSALGEKIEPDWDPSRERSARDAISRRASRRRVTVAVTVAVASTLSAVGGLTLMTRSAGTPPGAGVASGPVSVPAAPAAPAAPVETVVVTQLSPDTVLEPIPDRHGRGFALLAGGARFSVPHDTERTFVVTAGDVFIEDLGTTFTVRYIEGDRVAIAVEEGRVHVRAAATDTDISAGGTLEVPVSATVSPEKRAARVGPSWRPLAERGQYSEAHEALRKAGPSAVRDDVADLMLAADAARLSGHPADAVPYLERAVSGHPSAPHSALAAFTLGRVLLDELHRPKQAMEAFARARAAGGPLAEDALAREVEAASRAGDAAHSRDLALLYRRLYPNGRRAKAVSKFSGID